MQNVEQNFNPGLALIGLSGTSNDDDDSNETGQKRNGFRLARFMGLSSRHWTITTWNCPSLISRFVEHSNTINDFLFLFFNFDTVL